MTPRDYVAAAEVEAAGGDMSAVKATTLDLTGTTQIMDGSTEWTDPTSGGVSTTKDFTRPGAMGACIQQAQK